MIADLIDREALQDELDKIVKDYIADKSFQCNFAAGVICAIRDTVIAEAPAVDAVVLPCKIGDTVYAVNEIYEYGGKWRKELVPEVVEMFAVDTDEDSHSFDAFGKTVFLTLEEAEAALRSEVAPENMVQPTEG